MEQLINLSERDIVLKTKKGLKEYVEKILFDNIIKKVDENASFNNCEVSFKTLFGLDDQGLTIVNVRLLHNLNMYDDVEASTNVYFTNGFIDKLIDSNTNLEGQYKKIEVIPFLYDKNKDN